jgi:hypothetical protein
MSRWFQWYRYVTHTARGDMNESPKPYYAAALKHVLEQLRDLVNGKPGDETKPALDSFHEPLKCHESAVRTREETRYIDGTNGEYQPSRL